MWRSAQDAVGIGWMWFCCCCCFQSYGCIFPLNIRHRVFLNFYWNVAHIQKSVKIISIKWTCPTRNRILPAPGKVSPLLVMPLYFLSGTTLVTVPRKRSRSLPGGPGGCFPAHCSLHCTKCSPCWGPLTSSKLTDSTETSSVGLDMRWDITILFGWFMFKRCFDTIRGFSLYTFPEAHIYF